MSRLEWSWTRASRGSFVPPCSFGLVLAFRQFVMLRLYQRFVILLLLHMSTVNYGCFICEENFVSADWNEISNVTQGDHLFLFCSVLHPLVCLIIFPAIWNPMPPPPFLIIPGCSTVLTKLETRPLSLNSWNNPTFFISSLSSWLESANISCRQCSWLESANIPCRQCSWLESANISCRQCSWLESANIPCRQCSWLESANILCRQCSWLESANISCRQCSWLESANISCRQCSWLESANISCRQCSWLESANISCRQCSWLESANEIIVSMQLIGEI